jgi:hypothetical protein
VSSPTVVGLPVSFMRRARRSIICSILLYDAVFIETFREGYTFFEDGYFV